MTGKGQSLLKQPLFAAVVMGCPTAWRIHSCVLAKKSARHCLSMKRFEVYLGIVRGRFVVTCAYC